MPLDILTSIIVSFCSGYASGDIDRLLTCSDFIVNCTIKENISKKEIDKCFEDFKKGKRYEKESI